MKIDLLGIVQVNKATNSMEKEIEFRRELHRLIANIFTNEETFYTDCEELIERTKIKAKNAGNYLAKETGSKWSFKTYDYKIELTKSNIKKIQKYLDNEACDDEDAY